MDLSSVRSLKLEAARALRLSSGLDEGVRLDGRPAISIRRANGPVAGISLGAAPAPGSNDYRLAVRIQRRALQEDYAILAALQQLSAGEIEVSYIGAVRPHWQRQRHRPLQIGSSVAHHAITAGTIGAFPRRRSDGQRVLLSNAHVLAQDGLAQRGDAVLQPGPFDGGTEPADMVGGVLDWAPLTPAGPNLVDAAICELRADIDRTVLRGFGQLRGPRPTPADVGESVSKIGRTTGLTRGQVTAIELDDLIVDMEELGPTRFNGQIEIEGVLPEAFSAGGDSGALIVDPQGWAVGLLFAGSDHGGAHGRGLTYANDIGAVLAALDLELDV